MKKSNKLVKILLASVMMVMLVTGCGASFDIGGSDLENYASDNSSVEYYDETDYYTDQANVEGSYIIESDTIHVELWDMRSTSDAKSVFSATIEELAGISVYDSDSTTSAKSGTNYSGSTTTSSGDYSITDSDMFYRVVYCEDKLVYAEASKDSKEELNQVLVNLGVVSK